MEDNRRRRTRGRHQKKPLTAWILEFSKKVVVLCVLIHVAVFIYAAAVMWAFRDTMTLSTLISESSDILKTCVFGYMVKAGLENWQKIKNSKSGESTTQQEEAQG